MAPDKKTFDKIYIKDIQVRCLIGINPDERTKKQDVVINLKLEADLTRACASDSIGDTVDYSSIKKEIVEKAEQSSFFLIEKLAETIASICLKSPVVEGVTVLVEKPGALRFARSVGVEIYRRKEKG